MKRLTLLPWASLLGVLLAGIWIIYSCSMSEEPSAPTEPQPSITRVSQDSSGLILTYEGYLQPVIKIAILFKISDSTGSPILDLQCENITLFEDLEPISASESEYAFKNSPQQFTMYTLLLLDVSGSVEIDVLRAASNRFVSALFQAEPRINGSFIHMAVSLFDGRKDLIPLIDFETDSTKVLNSIAGLNESQRVDRSTNLNGAVIQGVNLLKNVIVPGNSSERISAGSLIIFSDGKDRAGWKSTQDVNHAINDAPPSIVRYSIGLECATCELDAAALKELGPNFRLASDPQELILTFEETATRINRDAKSRYLLEYCSPKRKDRHELKIKAKRNELEGALTIAYVADESYGTCKVDSAYRCGNRE